MTTKSCPLCEPAAERVISRGTLAVALWDGYPVSPGHALVASARHVGSWFELRGDEQAAMLLLLDEVRANVTTGFQPDGFNIGINDGPAAGQTIPHVHIHLIPRYHGDVADPRGGIRWVLADKADYWTGRR
ncbi:MAG: HIT family protein [Betaproteobacteria bacterium]|nr:HIT family protein [Betaproteobacteria bacterium]